MILEFAAQAQFHDVFAVAVRWQAGKEIVLNPEVRIVRLEDALELRLSGAWRLTANRPAADDVAREMGPGTPLRRLAFETSELTDWDSSLLIFIDGIDRLAGDASMDVDLAGLPDGVQRLVALARAVPKREDEEEVPRTPALDRLGQRFLASRGRVGDAVDFLGETTQAFGRLLTKGPQFRRADLLELTQQAGADALGIVSLVSLLMGLILAFVGAQQLRQFGASIYVADLVGVAMTRDMAALMTAIVMAGRSGAAYAAQLGIMKSNQEIDALSTMGIRPVDYLVVPRMIALFTMLPLLVLFADLLGILGGGMAAISMMDVSWT